MRVLLTMAAMAIAAPVGAQELIFSNDATMQCVERAGSVPDQLLCVGLSANACMSATPGGSSTAAMGGCLDLELSLWDAALNFNYQAARKRTKASDQEMRGSGGTAPGLDQTLRDMQRAWLVFRDATCDFERAQWGGGTGGGPATLDCLMRMTATQALYLNNAWLVD